VVARGVEVAGGLTSGLSLCDQRRLACLHLDLVTLVKGLNVFDGFDMVRKLDFMHLLPLQGRNTEAGFPSRCSLGILGGMRPGGDNSAALIGKD